MNERRVYDLENRSIDFAVEIIKLAEFVPKTQQAITLPVKYCEV